MAAGIPFTLSTFSNVRIEELAADTGGRLWMQLYIMKDRSIARDTVSYTHLDVYKRQAGLICWAT